MDTSKDYKTTIVSLQRIQNPGEYSKHMILKHSLESGMPVGAIKEKEVFHGTKQESIRFICSQGGFNRGLAADANGIVYYNYMSNGIVIIFVIIGFFNFLVNFHFISLH